MAMESLDFERAQYGGERVSLDPCALCGRGLVGEFYRTNGDLTCAVCAERIRAAMPADTREVFWRTAGVGAIAAVVVGGAYFLVLQFVETHGGGFGVGFAAIGAGYAIGTAMRRAAKGAGGRRYQWMAALLTYAAITIAFSADLLGTRNVPVWAYPLMALTPFANMLLGHFQLGLLELFLAGIGIRWAWGLLRSHGVKVTGPERHG